MAPTLVHFGYIDHSNEQTRMGLYFDEATAANFDDLFDPSPDGKIDVMRLANGVVTKLNETRVTASIIAHQAVASLPTGATAQRESAARMKYVDNVTGKSYRFDIPAPDDDFVPTGSDDINMAAAVWVTYKAAFELNCVSPVGNAVTLVSGRFVGRRN